MAFVPEGNSPAFLRGIRDSTFHILTDTGNIEHQITRQISRFGVFTGCVSFKGETGKQL